MLNRLLVRICDDQDTSVFLRGASTSFGIRIVGTGVMLGAHVVLARTTSAADYGFYSVTLAAVALMAVVVQLGMSQGAVRFVSEFRSTGRGGAILDFARVGERLIIWLSVCLMVAGGVAGRIFGDEYPEIWLLLVGSALLPAFASLQLLQQVLRGAKRMVDAQLWEQVLVPLILATLALTGYAFLGQLDYSHMVLLHTVALLVGTMALWRRVRSIASESGEGQSQKSTPISEWFSVSVPLGVVAVITVFLSQGEVLVLAFLVDGQEIGAYAVAVRVANVMIFGQYAANAIGGPMIGEFFARGDHAGLQRNVTLGVRVASVFSVSVLLLLAIFAEPILGLFGPEFRLAAGVLVILGVGQAVNAITGPVGPLLSVTNQHSPYMRIMISMATLKLVLLVPAIYFLGILGAALAAALVTIVRNLWLAWIAYKRLGIVSLPFGVSSKRT